MKLNDISFVMAYVLILYTVCGPYNKTSMTELHCNCAEVKKLFSEPLDNKNSGFKKETQSVTICIIAVGVH
jgi:hypothetical protein